MEQTIRPSGRRIRELRILRGLTQEELAAKASMGSKVSISRIENDQGGGVRPSSVSKLAAALGVPTEELFDGRQGRGPGRG